MSHPKKRHVKEKAKEKDEVKAGRAYNRSEKHREAESKAMKGKK